MIINTENTLVILASSSPRRKEYLSWICKEFEIIKPLTQEISNSTHPKDIVQDIAKEKMDWVLDHLKQNKKYEKNGKNTLVICADTIVTKDGVVYGKPTNHQEAYEMLKKLSGDYHQVITCVYLAYNDGKNWKTQNFQVDAKVLIPQGPLQEQLIGFYSQTDDPLDKAGSYGLQGFSQCFISKIEGSLSTIIGMPIYELIIEIKKLTS